MADGQDLDQKELDDLLNELDGGGDDQGLDIDLGDTDLADPGQNIDAVVPAQASLSPSASSGGGGGLSRAGNLDLLMDVSLRLSVEMGRARVQIQDVLGVREGSILELDKLQGEPVDIRVNDVLIARGEIVVIDETYGITVTEILDPSALLKVRNRLSSSGT